MVSTLPTEKSLSLPNFDAKAGIHYGVVDGTTSDLLIDIQQNGDSVEYEMYFDYLQFVALQAFVASSYKGERKWWLRWLTSREDYDKRDFTRLMQCSRAVKVTQKEPDFGRYFWQIRDTLKDIFPFDDDQVQHYVCKLEGVTYLCAMGDGHPYVFITDSPYVGWCRPCSPCYPNAGNADELQPYEQGLLTYLPHPQYLPEYEIKAAATRERGWLDRSEWMDVLNFGDWYGKTWLVAVPCGHFSISAIVEADHMGDAEEIAAEHEEFGRMIRIEPPDTADYIAVFEDDEGYVAQDLDGKVIQRADSRKGITVRESDHVSYTGDGRPYDTESIMVFGDEGRKVPYPVTRYVVQPLNKASAVPEGHVRCRVEWHAGCVLLVHFDEDDLELDFQNQDEQAEFCYACGLFELNESKGEKSAATSEGWEDCDPTKIESCPVDYYEIAKERRAEEGTETDVCR